MKRNQDLIRAIAIAAENLSLSDELRSLDGVPEDAFFVHAKPMKEAGLIECVLVETWGTETPEAIITGLTLDGHDFVAAARSETLWKKAEESVIGPTMSWTFAILKEWLKAEIKKSLPPLGGS